MSTLTRLLSLPRLLSSRPHLFKSLRATYLKGFYPDPITQQTLSQFLDDINYFERPKSFINIGLEKRHANQLTDKDTLKNAKNIKEPSLKQDLEEVFKSLEEETKMPLLDTTDAEVDPEQLKTLAINSGVFRDLFGKYSPDRDHIRLKQHQAERMDRLIPNYWITDQPFARVDRHMREPDPLVYFEPLVKISAKFINKSTSEKSSDREDSLYAHTSFYGNIIPAEEASTKPSIVLDGKFLYPNSDTSLSAKDDANWEAGNITSINFKQSDGKLYSVALVNLDYLHENNANLHWFVANIDPSKKIMSQELCEYLPVHGIQGFGYSRYVFLVFQHNTELDTVSSKINDFSLESRKFDTTKFLSDHEVCNIKPVGLSWFQTCWDQSSNRIFHEFLKLRAPVYEIKQTKLDKIPEKSYPGRVPFHIYLDHNRDKKDINEQVLLERIKNVDPYDYTDQYVPPRVPPTVFENEDVPSWMVNVLFKKHNKVGYWRGLRPASKTLPLNNNADLDFPLRPVVSANKKPPEAPNEYLSWKRKKQHKDMPTSKPPSEHQSVFIQDDHEIHIEEAKRIMKDFKQIYYSSEMNKLSFRSRQLDPSKPMLIYRAEEVPDLGECTAISRGVPVLPSGMEKEEEGEHHLQRAISAQQAYGHTGELVIPTPEVQMAPNTYYSELYSADYHIPRQLIHMQLFAIDQEFPDYDMDSEDEEWFLKNAKDLNPIQFERIMDKLEQQQMGRPKVLELEEAKLIAKDSEEENLVTEIYDYWVAKRLRVQIPLKPTVKQEKREGISSNSPYIAFRKRTEKMQTRKNRKNDEVSFEKMLKLKRDLKKAVNLLDLVKKRERIKRDQLSITVDIFKKRYELGDYSGHILTEVKTALQRARAQNNVNSYRDQDNKLSRPTDGHVRKRREYRKRQTNQNSISQNRSNVDQFEFGDSDEDSFKNRVASEDDEDAPDGPYTFKRKGGCYYLAPRTDYGNWPWYSNEEGGQAHSKYKYCLTYLSAGPIGRCIGLARRRVGRGGRIILDRAHSPDEYLGEYVTNCY